MRRVDDVFNIHKEGRTGGNGRRYVLHAVRQMIQSPATQEGLKLGELEGYYGHGRRQLTGKMRLPEVEVITVGGQQVVIENVPSNRTVALDVDDSGNVSHTQEVLDTAPGLIVQSMIDSWQGGWSWACEGPSTRQGDYPRAFYGFDYVKQPNYIPVSRQQAMFESVGVSNQDELIRHHLRANGFADEAHQPILESWGAMAQINSEIRAYEYDAMMLEGLLIEAKSHQAAMMADHEAALAEHRAATNQRKTMMLECLERLPIMLTRQQREAMARMETPEDLAVFTAMFESACRMQFGTLPLQGGGQATIVTRPQIAPAQQKNAMPPGGFLMQAKRTLFK